MGKPQLPLTDEEMTHKKKMAINDVRDSGKFIDDVKVEAESLPPETSSTSGGEVLGEENLDHSDSEDSVDIMERVWEVDHQFLIIC